MCFLAENRKHFLMKRRGRNRKEGERRSIYGPLLARKRGARGKIGKISGGEKVFIGSMLNSFRAKALGHMNLFPSFFESTCNFVSEQTPCKSGTDFLIKK